ncbi:Gp49 family protein [Aeromonas enteropelogenes]|uniref:Gp49 family protein n=1 Tax=Aeromonas enteropelogenes TaxID=29489 RepID=UPI003B9E9BE9
MSKQEQDVTGVDSLMDVAMGHCGDRRGGVIHIGNVMAGFLSHKRVDAAVIIAVRAKHEDGRMDFEIANPVDHELSIPYTASADMLVRFTPGVGDYIVLYKGGYVSFSPKDAFEDGYKMIAPTDGSDADMERDIEALDLTAPRVTPEQIDALMAGVVYHTHVVPGTTTTLATAIAANGFTLAIGMTACADPANFNEEFGAKYAIRDAESKARSQLWKLEGWRLKCELQR